MCVYARTCTIPLSMKGRYDICVMNSPVYLNVISMCWHAQRYVWHFSDMRQHVYARVQLTEAGVCRRAANCKNTTPEIEVRHRYLIQRMMRSQPRDKTTNQTSGKCLAHGRKGSRTQSKYLKLPSKWWAEIAVGEVCGHSTKSRTLSRGKPK